MIALVVEWGFCCCNRCVGSDAKPFARCSTIFFADLKWPEALANQLSGSLFRNSVGIVKIREFHLISELLASSS